MSTFLTATDYATTIKSSNLARITEDEEVSPAVLLDDAEAKAISMMKGFLNSRYLVDVIFAASGSGRHPIIVKYCVDVALYYLYSRLQPEQIPQMRKDNYDIAERWLRRVSLQEINPPDLPMPANKAKDYILWSSNPKTANHIE